MNYQPRTVERLIEILRARSENPRSWEREAAHELEHLSVGYRELIVEREIKNTRLQELRAEMDAAAGLKAAALRILRTAATMDNDAMHLRVPRKLIGELRASLDADTKSIAGQIELAAARAKVRDVIVPQADENSK